MHWIDIVFIAIIIVFAIIGLSKGLFDSILSLVASVGSIFLAFWASKPVAGFLNKTLNVDDFFKKFLVNTLHISADGIGDHTLPELAKICTLVLSMIIVYLLIKATIWLLSRLFDSVSANSTALSGMNRLFGLLFGAARGFAIILIALGLTNVACKIEVVNTNVHNFLAPSTITRKVNDYVHDWVEKDLNRIIDDFVDDLLKPDEKNPDKNPDDVNGEDKQKVVDKVRDNFSEAKFADKKVITKDSFTLNLIDKQVEGDSTVTISYNDLKLFKVEDGIDKDTGKTPKANTTGKVIYEGLEFNTSYKLQFEVIFKIDTKAAVKTLTISFVTSDLTNEEVLNLAQEELTNDKLVISETTDTQVIITLLNELTVGGKKVTVTYSDFVIKTGDLEILKTPDTTSNPGTAVYTELTADTSYTVTVNAKLKLKETTVVKELTLTFKTNTAPAA